MSAEGAFIASGHIEVSGGSKGLQDVAVDHNGKVFITDGNDSAKVLNADLTRSHYMHIDGEFKGPSGITIDADGMVYIADWCNNNVQKFAHEGKLSAVIDSKGEEGGRLNRPFGLCVDGNGILYVTESNTVSMFTRGGRFLGYIGDDDGSCFKDAWFIVSNQTGRLYISDNNGVVTY